MASDAAELFGAQRARDNEDHHWEVFFAAKISEDVDEEEAEVFGIAGGWVHESITVQADADGENAIRKAKEYVMNPARYGVEVLQFRLRGLNAKSTAEVR